MNVLNQSTRRQFLKKILHLSALGAGSGTLLASVWGCGDRHFKELPKPDGSFVGILPFVGEGDVPLETVTGEGLRGRRFIDLTTLSSDALTTPTERFYVRTRYPDRLDSPQPWKISINGLVENPCEILLKDVLPNATDQGIVVMECAGNDRWSRFGLISAARWQGISLRDVLSRVKPLSAATTIRVVGYDDHSQPDPLSWPGASWVFTPKELHDAGAFLATGMNGAPLSRDHGAPIRLVVPGWYGCVSIKWVKEIVFADDEEPATNQMKEFAGRTLQAGMPDLAREYYSALVDPAAVPVRIEKWRADEATAYRIVGIAWGGTQPVKALSIRIGEERAFVPVQHFLPWPLHGWNLWSHMWYPTTSGTYTFRLRIVTSNRAATRKLDSGHYDRTVMVTTG